MCLVKGEKLLEFPVANQLWCDMAVLEHSHLVLIIWLKSYKIIQIQSLFYIFTVMLKIVHNNNEFMKILFNALVIFTDL